MIINMNGAKAPETPSPTLQEKTVTPETLPTVIGADEGYDGLSQVTVNPDSQLKAENIRSGKTIFGVDGAFVGEKVYTNEIDLNVFCPFSLIYQSTFATWFNELVGYGGVYYDAVITETTKPESAIGIQYNSQVLTTEYYGYYMLSEKDTYTTNTYIPSGGSTKWYEVNGTIPAGNHPISAYGNSGYTHLKGDFVVVPVTKSGYSVMWVPTESDWSECVVHVDTEVTPNAVNNKVFNISIPEDLTFNYKFYEYSANEHTYIRLGLIPIKAVYT